MLRDLQLIIFMMQPCLYQTMQYSTLPNCAGQVLPAADNYKVLETKSKLSCAAHCDKESDCLSIQFGQGTCYLNDVLNNGSCVGMIVDASLKYYQKKQPSCQHGGIMVAEACQCVNGYVGTYCERLMNDCSEGFLSPHGYNQTSQFYTIHPNTSSVPFTVYCEMKKGGRTYFQYHSTSSFYFNRTWPDYREGFGDQKSDQWLGLDKMHLITASASFRLIVYMRLGNSTVYHQNYYDFVVRNETDLYQMNFSVSVPHTKISLGDSLSDLRGVPFSTYDNDNDNSVSNCASDRRSGWWYDNCALCNFNGELLKPADSIRTVDYEAFWENDLQDAVPVQTRMWVTYMGL